MVTLSQRAVSESRGSINDREWHRVATLRESRCIINQANRVITSLVIQPRRVGARHAADRSRRRIRRPRLPPGSGRHRRLVASTHAHGPRRAPRGPAPDGRSAARARAPQPWQSCSTSRHLLAFEPFTFQCSVHCWESAPLPNPVTVRFPLLPLHPRTYRVPRDCLVTAHLLSAPPGHSEK